MSRRGRDEGLLAREDIGYGQARPYEFNYGPGMVEPRERRFGRDGARRAPEPPPPGYGPYHQRLQRRRRPDRWIRADVEERLFHDSWVDADAITVDVTDGIVTLMGMLPNVDEIRGAIEDAERTDGVRGVRNRLEVRP